MNKSPFLSITHAQPLTPPDYTEPNATTIPWHYGDPLGEQRGPRIIDHSNARISYVGGSDALDLCERLLSQHFEPPADGSFVATNALNLDAQGRVLQAVHMLVSTQGVYLYGEVGVSALAAYLEQMKFWSDVTINPHADDDVALLRLIHGAAVPSLPEVIAVGDHGWCTDVLIPRATLADVAKQAVDEHWPLGGYTALEAARNAALWPLVGVDTDEKTIPHESTTWINTAVHLHKGCYRGQETVSRVHNLGRAPRAIVRVHLDGSVPQLPTPGTQITCGGRGVGTLGTIIQDCDYGPIGLATIKRSALGKTPLTANDCALAIDPDTLPDDNEPKPGKLAQERLRSPQVRG